MNEKLKPLTAKSAAAPAPAAAEKPAKPVPAAKVASAKKPAAKAASPQAVAVPAKSEAAKTEKPAKEEKPQKVKLVRDSFTMPENEYGKIAELKKKCLQGGVHVKKSELLRAGLLTLAKLSDADLLAAMGQVEILKTGRPARS